nr:RHS repeat-associated core domain-containing protein [Pseudomonas protegens]
MRFTYDDWGNLSEKSSTNGATQRFTYDCENRLIHAQTWHGATLHSEARYHYDALGRRIAKAVTQSGQTQDTTFLWQGLRLLQEQQPQRHSTYVYETDSYAPLARIDTDPKLPEHPGQTYYFHTDQIGTPQEMTDAQGHVVWRAYYKAWGGLEALSPNTVEQNLRFQGQYHDRESGLYYNTFRYYDPTVGRFTTQDPIGLAGGENLYRYAPNALGWIDPRGLITYNTMPGIEGFQKHHIIPQQLKGHDLIKAADLNIHDIKNVIHLPTSAAHHPTRTIHSGSHPTYTKNIQAQMDALLKLGKDSKWSKADYKKAVNELIKNERAGLRSGKTVLNKRSIRTGSC